MPTLLAESVYLSFMTELWRLDLMHIAATKYAKRMEMISDLGAFVTGDRELLTKKEEISKIIKMPVPSPSEYVQDLGLKADNEREK